MKSSAGEGKPAGTLTPHKGNAIAWAFTSNDTGRHASTKLYIFTV